MFYKTRWNYLIFQDLYAVSKVNGAEQETKRVRRDETYITQSFSL